jgi:hypothetical protein
LKKTHHKKRTGRQSGSNSKSAYLASVRLQVQTTVPPKRKRIKGERKHHRPILQHSNSPAHTRATCWPPVVCVSPQGRDFMATDTEVTSVSPSNSTSTYRHIAQQENHKPTRLHREKGTRWSHDGGCVSRRKLEAQDRMYHGLLFSFFCTGA